MDRHSLSPEHIHSGRSVGSPQPPSRSPSIEGQRRSFSKSMSPERYSRSYSRSPSGSRSHRRRSYSSSRRRRRSYSRSYSRSPRRRRHRNRRSYSRSRSRSRSYSPHYSRRRRRGHSRSHSPLSHRRRHQGNRYNPSPCRVVGVFGLSLYTSEKDLKDVFGRYGKLEHVNIVYDYMTGRSRGFGFVYFEDCEDASDAKEQCNGLELDGRRIRVDFSITKRAHTPTPGVYMGRPTRGSSSRDSRDTRDTRDSGRSSFDSRDYDRDYDGPSRSSGGGGGGGSSGGNYYY